MEVVRQAFESLGFWGVTTFLASGNVRFETRAAKVEALERRIERMLSQALGFDAPVFIRTCSEVARIAAHEPLVRSRIRNADLNVILLTDSLDEESKAKLMALRTDTDDFRVHGREIYWWRRKKRGTSEFSTVPLTKALHRPFTIRSTSTIRRLAARLDR
jgi:uncharacterized protein (DUF1697 family)